MDVRCLAEINLLNFSVTFCFETFRYYLESLLVVYFFSNMDAVESNNSTVTCNDEVPTENPQTNSFENYVENGKIESDLVENRCSFSEISITTSSDNSNSNDNNSDGDKVEAMCKSHSDDEAKQNGFLGDNLRNLPRRSNSARFSRQKSIDFSTEEPPFLCRAIKNYRPRCDTDPSVFKRPRAGVLDSLIQQTVKITTGQLGLDIESQPPSLGPVEPPHSDSEDAPLDYIGSANSICVGIRSAPSSPMAPLQGQSDTHGQSVVSLTTLSRSPSHHNATKLDSKSLKLRTSPGSAPRIRNEIPEKKRKELSSSREKKFHRHFQQVSKEERLINYFSCALVSDFLLQGHLYITENYFAFYSNVFGFVTKLLIPTATVIKISKEKTAKIIPNAVGVTTADERHVFGSFMSRETAFRLMCSVCPPLEPIERIPKVPDVEVSEECSVEDDSSCSISGNESPPQIISCTPEPTTQRIRQRSIPAHIAPDVVDSPKELVSTLTTAKPLIAAPVTWPKSPPPRIVSTSNRKLNPIYIGVILTIVLAIFSAYLYHKVCEMESMINYSPPNYKIDPDNDLDVYAETFKWQKEMELKSAQEIQSLINSHLELIARLRKSLENLSLLIHQHNIMFDTMRQRSTADRPSGVDDASPMEQHLTT